MPYYSSSSSSSSTHNIATTLLLLLILIPSLKLLINGLNSLSTFVLCLFFKAPPCILLSLLKGLKVPTDAFLTAFQVLAEAFRSILVTLIGVVLEILGSSFMALLGLVKSVVFGSFEASGLGLVDLLDKTKASWSGSLFEQVRGIVASVFEKIVESAFDMASSSAGSLFNLAIMSISTLFNEPSSAIGRMVETLKSSLESGSSIEGVRGIVRGFIENVVNVVLGAGISSSTSGSIEILKTIFGVVRDSGYSLGGLLENTRAALDVLRMEDLRGLIEGICKLGVNMVFKYFIG